MNLEYASWLAGMASGGMIVLGARWPALGFVALAPLGWTMLSASPLEVSVAAALAGAISSLPGVWTKTLRGLIPLAVCSAGTSWALAYALAGWIVHRLGPGALLLALPLAAILSTLVPRAAGAPRWGSNPLACTQQRWLVMVHTARFAHLGDAVPAALLALCSASLCLGARAPGLLLLAAGAASAALLGFGWQSLRRAERHGGTVQRVRVAAVVADGPAPPSGVVTGLWPAESLDYRDVEATIARYQPHVALAAQRGARVLVLPEVAVYLDGAARPRWLEAVRAWARTHEVAIVAPYFNAELPRNELVIVDARGVVAEHEKQHPARGLEPPRRQRLPVGPHEVVADGCELPLSAAICVDLDYADTARSARRAGGLLTVPANDWPEFARMHHRAAVWTAVLARVPVVRATGHGISAIFDRAGRVIAQQSSEQGPVVLVADVEL